MLSRRAINFARRFWPPPWTRPDSTLSPTSAPQRHSREEIIRLAYLLLLGREPESELVVKEKAAHFRTIEEIRRHFMSSDEFKMQQGVVRSAIDEGYNAPPTTIETIVSEEVLERLFGRIQRQWKELGATEPFWSVLTSAEFKGENFERHAQEFYDSGRANAALVDTFANRNMVAIPHGTCFELGCGVGRVTRFLAERFERVIAIDISDGNLSYCIDYMDKSGVKNVETVLVKSPRDLTKLQPSDFLFSTIVLQHNPPPVQRFMLDRLLAKISPGGSCLFQLPTHVRRYRFASAEYLKSEETDSMEMHCLPMHVVFQVMKENGFTPLEVLMDSWTGHYGSHTFFATKK
jgi:2-polyprenyl-3-methyl-5-hydroxy-6-metoxy-1,4-benzoquinol methylase